LAISSGAQAAEKRGTVDDVRVTAAGTLKVDMILKADDDASQSYFAICDMDASWTATRGSKTITITKETCQAWHSALIAAQLSGREVSIDWEGDTAVKYDEVGNNEPPSGLILR
jgi:hypothetical protein